MVYNPNHPIGRTHKSLSLSKFFALSRENGGLAFISEWHIHHILLIMHHINLSQKTRYGDLYFQGVKWGVGLSIQYQDTLTMICDLVLNSR